MPVAGIAIPELLAMLASVIAGLFVGRTAVLQVREFRSRTQEDAIITRILGLQFHAPSEPPKPAENAREPDSN